MSVLAFEIFFLVLLGVASLAMAWFAGFVVYRLFNDRVYVGGRWNQVKGDFFGQEDLTVTRRAVSAGWFLTRNLLTKAELVQQDYEGFAETDIRNGGQFRGIAIEGVIAF